MSKKLVTSLIALFLTITSSSAQVDYQERQRIDSLIWANPITDVNAILDSFEIVKHIGGVVDGFNFPPTAEELRYNRIVGYLFRLPFPEVEKLLEDDNTVAKAQAFIVLLKVYPNKITKKHLEIFKDRSKLYLYTSKEIVEAPMTLGEYCQMAYESEKSESD